MANRSSPAVRKRTRLHVATAFVAGVVLAVPGVFLAQSLADRPSAIDRNIAALEAAEQRNAAAATRELASTATGVHAGLVPVVKAMAASAAAGPQRLAEWSAALTTARATLDPTAGSSSNGVNLGRMGFVESIDLLQRSIALYRTASTVQGPVRTTVLGHAAAVRASAVRVWAVAATELDMVALTHDLGHIHLYLPADDGSLPMIPR